MDTELYTGGFSRAATDHQWKIPANTTLPLIYKKIKFHFLFTPFTGPDIIHAVSMGQWNPGGTHYPSDRTGGGNYHFNGAFPPVLNGKGFIIQWKKTTGTW